MPIYIGDTEITGGRLYIGSTEIDNVQAGSTQVFRNTAFINNLTISKTSATNAAGTATVNIIGDAGAKWTLSDNVSWASLSATSGTIPASGTSSVTLNYNANGNNSAARTVTITVGVQANQNTELKSGLDTTETLSQAAGPVVPVISVGSVETSSASVYVDGSSWNSSSNGTYSYSVSGCGISTSGTGSSSHLSFSSSGYSAPSCGNSCTITVSVSRSGYQSGSGSTTKSGAYPILNISITQPSISHTCPASQGSLTFNSLQGNSQNNRVRSTNCAGTGYPSTYSTAQCVCGSGTDSEGQSGGCENVSPVYYSHSSGSNYTYSSGITYSSLCFFAYKEWDNTSCPF